MLVATYSGRESKDGHQHAVCNIRCVTCVTSIDVNRSVRSTINLECVSRTGRSGASCGGQYRSCFFFSLMTGQTFGDLLIDICTS